MPFAATVLPLGERVQLLEPRRSSPDGEVPGGTMGTIESYQDDDVKVIWDNGVETTMSINDDLIIKDMGEKVDHLLRITCVLPLSPFVQRCVEERQRSKQQFDAADSAYVFMRLLRSQIRLNFPHAIITSNITDIDKPMVWATDRQFATETATEREDIHRKISELYHDTLSGSEWLVNAYSVDEFQDDWEDTDLPLKGHTLYRNRENKAVWKWQDRVFWARDDVRASLKVAAFAEIDQRKN